MKKRWKTVASIALVGLLLGVIAYAVIPAHYKASSTVAVNPMSTDPLTTTVDTTRAVNMPTEEGLITSREVAKAASQELGPDEIGLGIPAEPLFRSMHAVIAPRKRLIA